MVRFVGIGIDNGRGGLLMFRTLKLFDEFRKTIWRDHPEGWNMVFEFVAQNNLERTVTRRFGLLEKSLEGACLIFGSKEETANRLASEARLILSDPETTAALEISAIDKTVTSGVVRGPEKYTYTYPIKEALIPPETDIIEQYRQFARIYPVETEGPHSMIFES